MTQAPQEPWTVLKLINWTKDYLARQGTDQPRLAAEVLLAHVLGCKRLELYTRFETQPTPEKLVEYRELVRRAGQREPVAYLVGHKEFFSLDLLVSPAVLIPRPETELLAERAIDFLRALGRPGTYWDACTGSGAVAVAVGRHVGQGRILATDISPEALEIARQNVERHKLTERTIICQADLLLLPAEAKELAPFDCITANPPYVTRAQMAELPPEVRHEPASALVAGPEGLDCIDPILRQAGDVLTGGGLLAVEIGFDQAEKVYDLARQAGLYDRIELAKDLAGIERVLLAWKKT